MIEIMWQMTQKMSFKVTCVGIIFAIVLFCILNIRTMLNMRRLGFRARMHKTS